MPLRMQVDAGGAKYLSFAKKKLADLKRFMAYAKLRTLSKHILADTGVNIWLQSVNIGNGVFLDWIRISAAAGTIILQTNTNEYSVIRWDGSLVASLDSTGHPWSGFAMHEAIGTKILFCATSGASLSTAYVVEAMDFSTVSGPEDYSAYAIASFTFRQPPAVDGVLPAKQWAGGPEFGSATTLAGASVSLAEQDFSALDLATLSGALDTGSGVQSSFNWNGGDGSVAVVDLGRDTAPVTEYEFAAIDMDTGVGTRVVMAGSNTGTPTESVFPICTNSTKLLRTYGDSTGAYVEVRSLTDGSLVGRAFLTDTVDATNLTWKVMRCDETRALVIFGEGFTPTAYMGFAVNLAALTATDITEKLNVGLSLLQLGNTDLSRAIILDANITGTIVAAPEGGGGGGGGGGGPR